MVSETGRGVRERDGGEGMYHAVSGSGAGWVAVGLAGVKVQVGDTIWRVRRCGNDTEVALSLHHCSNNPCSTD